MRAKYAQLELPWIVVSELAFVETSSAAFRLRKNGSVTEAQAHFISLAATRQLETLAHVSMSRTVVGEASRLTKVYSIRSLDAIQLASALMARSALNDSDMQFISADISLLAYAEAEGFRVWNPANLSDPL